MPTVSVVVPTYNRADHLERTIESVLDQRFGDFELVVVNDGSTDETAAVIDRFDDPRIRALSHETNRGGSAARNTGIAASRGEYVAFLDDDDEWLPDKLGRQVAHLEARSDEWVAVYCDFENVRHGPGKRLRRLAKRVMVDRGASDGKRQGGASLIPATLSMDITLGGASTLLVRRDVLERLDGFDPAFERHQDWEFVIRLLRVGKLAYLDEVLVKKHETGRPSADDLRDAKRTLFEKFGPEIERAERNGIDVTGAHRFDLAKRYFEEGRFRDGACCLNDADVETRGLARAVVVGTIATLFRS